MSALDPATTTLGDVCTQALKESGAFGIGQTPNAEDITDAWIRLQWMLQQWQQKRWLIWHLKDYSKVSTGATFYTIGAGGDIDTGAGTARPAKIEAAFIRQLAASPGLPVDYPMRILQSMEDYSRIALKSLQSFPGWVFLDPDLPLGKLYYYPVPQSTIYEVHVILKQPLPVSYATQATVFNVPYEYYAAMLYNLALRLRNKYGMKAAPGDMLPGLAKDSLNVLRNANSAIQELGLPDNLARQGLYNVYSDQFY